MSFTENYVQPTGSNLNSGSTDADAALFTFINGNWDAATGVFTAAGADLSAVVAALATGYVSASVYNDGASLAVFIGRITAVNDTLDTVTVSLTAKSGTAPTTSATGRTIKVGGAWKGPNAAEAFPFGFVAGAMVNAAGDMPRVNFKAGTNYAITAAMAHSIAGPIRCQGYATTPGDGGKFTVDGGTSGASYVLLTLGGAQPAALYDCILQNNGATGSAAGLVTSGTNQTDLCRVVVHAVRGDGFTISSNSTLFECEAYDCNQSNTANMAGFTLAAGGQVVRCVSHDNAGSNALGFHNATGHAMIGCIADSNGSHGIRAANISNLNTYISCDLYNNGGSGIAAGVSGSNIQFQVESCNFVKNGVYGIDMAGISGVRHGRVVNCGFGAGTQANTSGQVNGAGSVDVIGSVAYASDVTPWVDPANGDFRINLAAAKGTGRGRFTQTQAGYAGTIGYPDRGAGQHLETAGGGLVLPQSFDGGYSD